MTSRARIFDARCGKTPADLLRFVRALGWIARWRLRARGELTMALTELAARPARDAATLDATLDATLCAAHRAAHRARIWFGWGDVCMNSSVATLGLLGGHTGLRLHIGFRSAELGRHEGHAWVSLGGELLLDDDAANGAYHHARIYTFDHGQLRIE